MKILKLFLLLAVMGLNARKTAIAASRDAAPARQYAITDVTIVDVEKGIPIPRQTVIVVNDRIDQIGESETIKI